MDDLVDEATRVRDREMHELYHGMASKGQQQSAAAAGGKADAAAAAGGKATASATAAMSSRQPDQPRPNAPAAGTRGTEKEEEEEDEEFDEADFKRWIASAKAAGGRAAPLADEDTWPSGKGEEEQQASATSKRSW